MGETINDRIKFLIDEHYSGNVSAFAREIGVKQPTLNTIVGERRSKPSYDVINAIALKSKVDISWLITGQGQREAEEAAIQVLNHPKAVEQKFENQDITLYDIEAAANLKTLMADKNQNILGKISIPNMPKCDGALFVTGDSMYPILKSGDIVGYKEIHDFNNIIFGEMYLVSFDMEGDEFLAVKYVKKSEQNGCVKLVSYNLHHDPKDVPLNHISAIALVKFSVRKNVIK